MSIDPQETANDFVSTVTAVKAPDVYLPGSIPKGSRIDSTSSTGKQSINEVVKGVPLKMLFINAVPTPPPLTEVYERLGLSRVQGGRYLKELIKSGLALVHEFHPSRRGGFIKIIQNTDYAYLQLRQFGIEQPSHVTQGGWEHNLGCRVMGEIGKQKHYQVFYEVPIGAKGNIRGDVVLQAPTGMRIYVQCGISSPEREVRNALKALETPAVSAGKFLLVCRDKKFATQVIQFIKKQDTSGQALEQISIKLIGDILEYYYTKSEGELL